MTSVMAVLLPLILAALLIGFAVLGSRLGRRRAIVEKYVLLPAYAVLLIVGGAYLVVERDWLMVAPALIGGFVVLAPLLRRRGKQDPAAGGR